MYPLDLINSDCWTLISSIWTYTPSLTLKSLKGSLHSQNVKEEHFLQAEPVSVYMCAGECCFKTWEKNNVILSFQIFLSLSLPVKKAPQKKYEFGVRVLKQHGPLQAPLHSIAASVERLWCFQDRALQGHHTWLRCCCFLPFCVTCQEQLLLSTIDNVPLRKWDQAREKTKKSSLNERPPKVLVCCALRKPGANTENIWQAGWEARAFTLSGCCRVTCSRSIRFNGLLGSVKRSAGCFVISCSQSPFVKTFWLNVFFLLLNGA